MKFQILDGKHQKFTKTDDNERTTIVDIYVKGDIVEEEVDLAKRFNRPGAKKFSRVSDDIPVICSRPHNGKHVSQRVKESKPTHVEPVVDMTAEAIPGDIQDAFTGLTVKELRDIAAEEEIDLGEATKKAEILKALRKHVGE